MSFWCFSCFSLFNLQGTNRSNKRSLIISGSLLVVKHFSNFFQVFLSCCHPTGSLELLYHITPFRSCQHLFRTFSQLPVGFPFRCCPCVRRSVNIPNPSPLVNTFLRLFSSFFELFPQPPDMVVSLPLYHYFLQIGRAHV